MSEGPIRCSDELTRRILEHHRRIGVALGAAVQQMQQDGRRFHGRMVEATLAAERARLRALRDYRIAHTPRLLRPFARVVAHLAYQITLAWEDLPPERKRR
jgi:hypothetical protein